MRVWMGPKYNESNKYNQLLSESLEGIGLEVNDVKRQQFAKLRRGDVLHVHWIHPLYQNRNPIIFLLRSLIVGMIFTLLRLKGVTIIWTIHNLYPHSMKFKTMERWTRRMVINLCSKCIAATEFIKKQVVDEFGVSGDKIVVIPHGHYVGVYEQQGKDYRKAYGIPADSFVYLFVGAIKPYKGIDKLVEAFNQIKNEKTYLIIAGKPSADVEAYLNGVQDRERIIFDLRFVPDEEVADLIVSCDAFVLPFKEITTSGSAILALSFRKPVVMPKTPFGDEYFAPEIAAIYDTSKGGTLETAMLEVQQMRKEQTDPVYDVLLAKLDWKTIAYQTSGVYRNEPIVQSLKGVG